MNFQMPSPEVQQEQMRMWEVKSCWTRLTNQASLLAWHGNGSVESVGWGPTTGGGGDIRREGSDDLCQVANMPEKLGGKGES